MKHIQISIGIWSYCLGLSMIVESYLLTGLPFSYYAVLTTLGICILASGFSLLHPNNLK